jgi:uncharacterized SAM-dependent methyltransferase
LKEDLSHPPIFAKEYPMSPTVQIAIHPSQFPKNVAADLRTSLRSRQVNHKFHYDSYKQTQKWLALHHAFSPSRTETACAVAYDSSFAALGKRISSPRIQLISLGCGGGQKDARLLRGLAQAGRQVRYTPLDVSLPMVLIALQAARAVLDPRCATLDAGNCSGMVCDLATADDLPAVFADQSAPGQARLITFFGMIPNFEPQLILPKLAALLRAGDYLLFSANLAPGNDYAAGVRRVLPLYDNPLTEDWLLTFLLDLGVERSDGNLEWTIEGGSGTGGLLRLAAYFGFRQNRALEVDGEQFAFRAGERLRLFFSYRHTPERLRALLLDHGLAVQAQWLADSEEEGVFLVQSEVNRQPASPAPP